MPPVILLLEDNEEFRTILAENLEDEGFEVLQAGSSQQAVEVSAKTRVDLLITDVRMAGADGIEALAEMRKKRPLLRSIIITGYANDEAPPRAIKEGASDYLYKPFKLSDLLASVDRVLNAERDSSHAQAALGALLGSFARLGSAVSSLISHQQLKLVESRRQHAFNGLYVAIRSKSFNVEQALHIWDSLEDLERKREGLTSGKLDLALCRDLGEGYSWVVTVLEALKKNNSPLLRGREKERVVRERFAHLYSAVQNGKISATDLSLGPHLRKIDPMTLSQSPELAKMHRRFWGD